MAKEKACTCSVPKVDCELVDGPLAGTTLRLPLSRGIIHVEGGVAYIYFHTSGHQYSYDSSVEVGEA